MKGAAVKESAAVTTGNHKANGQFAKGNAANLNGRPKSSRHKLSERFIGDVYKAWERHGDNVLYAMVYKEPAKLAQIVASLVPKDLNLNVNVGTQFLDAVAELEANSQQLERQDTQVIDAQVVSPASEADGKVIEAKATLIPAGSSDE